MRATYQLNTEKLEYNYRVLVERDHENQVGAPGHQLSRPGFTVWPAVQSGSNLTASPSCLPFI